MFSEIITLVINSKMREIYYDKVFGQTAKPEVMMDYKHFGK